MILRRFKDFSSQHRDAPDNRRFLTVCIYSKNCFVLVIWFFIHASKYALLAGWSSDVYFLTLFAFCRSLSEMYLLTKDLTRQELQFWFWHPRKDRRFIVMLFILTDQKLSRRNLTIFMTMPLYHHIAILCHILSIANWS